MREQANGGDSRPVTQMAQALDRGDAKAAAKAAMQIPGVYQDGPLRAVASGQVTYQTANVNDYTTYTDGWLTNLLERGIIPQTQTFGMVGITSATSTYGGSLGGNYQGSFAQRHSIAYDPYGGAYGYERGLAIAHDYAQSHKWSGGRWSFGDNSKSGGGGFGGGSSSGNSGSGKSSGGIGRGGFYDKDTGAPKGSSSSGGEDSSKPVLIDLDGNGISVTEFSHSTIYLDTAGDGLSHRTAWAGA